MHKRTRNYVIVFGIVAFFVLSYFGLLRRYLSVAYIASKRDLLIDYANRHPIKAALLFMTAYFVETITLIPGAATLSLLGGMVFGTTRATIYIIVSASLGACVLFWFIRLLLHEFVQQRFGRRVDRFNQFIAKYGVYVFLIVRMIPIVPFWFVNVAAPLTPVGFWVFAVTTVVGMVPLVILFAYAGHGLSDVQETKDLMTFGFWFPFVIMVISMIITVVIARYWKETEGIE